MTASLPPLKSDASSGQLGWNPYVFPSLAVPFMAISFDGSMARLVRVFWYVEYAPELIGTIVLKPSLPPSSWMQTSALYPLTYGLPASARRPPRPPRMVAETSVAAPARRTSRRDGWIFTGIS